MRISTCRSKFASSAGVRLSMPSAIIFLTSATAGVLPYFRSLSFHSRPLPGRFQPSTQSLTYRAQSMPKSTSVARTDQRNSCWSIISNAAPFGLFASERMPLLPEAAAEIGEEEVVRRSAPACRVRDNTSGPDGPSAMLAIGGTIQEACPGVMQDARVSRRSRDRGCSALRRTDSRCASRCRRLRRDRPSGPRSPPSELLSQVNRLPCWSNASSCGLRRPEAKTSRSLPSGLQRSTEPRVGIKQVSVFWS